MDYYNTKNPVGKLASSPPDKACAVIVPNSSITEPAVTNFEKFVC